MAAVPLSAGKTGLAMRLRAARPCILPATRLVADLEERLVEAGYGNEDVSALARAIRR